MRSPRTTAALTAAILLIAPAIARAQDADDEIRKQAQEHYKQGAASFKAGKYAEAIKSLKRSYTLAKLPALLVSIARSYEKLNDLDNAIYFFKKYLAEAPPDAKDRKQIEQALAAVQAKKDAPPEEEAQEATRPGGTAAEPPPPPAKRPEPPPAEETRKKPVAAAPEPPPPPPAEPTPAPREPGPRRSGAGTTEWAHTPIDAAPPNVCLDVKVQTPVMKGVDVWLFFRGQGESDFSQIKMKRHGSEKAATIPPTAMTGKSIQYYIEARDATGSVVKTAGTRVDPNIVFLDSSAPPMCGTAVAGGSDDSGEAAPTAAPQEVDEEALKRKAADDKRRFCDQHPLDARCAQPGKRGTAAAAAAGGRTFSAIGWAGLGLAIGGAVIGGGGGGAAFGFMSGRQSSVGGDARDADCAMNQGISAMRGEKCFFGGNSIIPNYATYEAQAIAAGIAAPVLFGAGGALLAAGIIMMAYDRATIAPAAAQDRSPPKKKKGRAELPPPRVRDLLVAPSLSPTSVGLAAGFRF